MYEEYEVVCRNCHVQIMDDKGDHYECPNCGTELLKEDV